jgi:minor extracellular serine protease Vpr
MLKSSEVVRRLFSSGDWALGFSAPTLTVPAKGTATVTAYISPATGPMYGQYGGYIQFTPQGKGQVYGVPFAGFVGDYQGIRTLAPTANEFPLLGILIGGSYYGVPENWPYTMEDGNILQLLIHFDHHPRSFKVDVYANSGKDWHRAYSEDYLPRNSSSTGFYAFPFDGTTFAGNKAYTLPDGTYYLKVSVLKALGDPNNPAHWEIWTSPQFVIDRP